ncbi:RCC1 domain-containing protein [Paenibacillus antri]|nr:carboxypeptidase regulatory-like domain-containing protein [Paenibacillus antri]
MKKHKMLRTCAAVLALTAGMQLGFPAVSHGAEAAALQGVVKDAAGAPMPGVTVQLHTDYESHSVVTDTYGHYGFNEVYDEVSSLQVATPGYRAFAAKDVDVGGGGALDVHLTPYAGTEVGAWKAASQTSRHLVLLAGDGTVWTVGDNSDGQLGDGTTIDRYVLMQVPDLTDVVEVAAGEEFTLALKSDGTVWAWGDNGSGQLGDESGLDRWFPAEVPGLADVVSIAVGKYHALAADANGKVYGWGENYNGQLGVEPTGAAYVLKKPTLIPDLNGVTKVVAGDYFSAALSEGNVFTWGSDSFRQLGRMTDPYTNLYYKPLPATGVSDATLIAAADDSMLAAGGGTIWGWGNNDSGQLTYNFGASGKNEVSGIGTILSLAAGDRHSVAVTVTGAVYTWGGNGDGQLGRGSYPLTSPQPVTALNDAVSVSSGENTVFALRADGSFWYWGLGAGMEDILGLQERRYAPYLVPALEQLDVWSRTTVSGTVTDVANGSPIEGANVRVSWGEGGSTEMTTEADGTFAFQLPPYDNYNIVVEKDGYWSSTNDWFELAPGSVGATINPVLEVGIPRIELNGDPIVILKPGDPYVDAGYYSVTDDKDEELYVEVSGAVNAAEPGVYRIEYTVEDSDGYVTTVYRTVLVLSDDPEPAASEATFIDTLPIESVIDGTLFWRVDEGTAPETYYIVVADGDRNIQYSLGEVEVNEAGLYSFRLPDWIESAESNAFIGILAGAHKASYVPIADAATPEDVFAQVRTAADRAGDGFRMDDAAAFLRYAPDLTGDGSFDRIDVTLLLRAIPSIAFE